MTFGRLAGTEIAQNLGKSQSQVNGLSIREEIISRKIESIMMMDKDILVGEGRSLKAGA